MIATLNYDYPLDLSNPSHVEVLLQNAGTRFWKSFVESASLEYVEDGERIAREVARTLLGQNPQTIPVPEWNSNGAIDRFIQAQLNVNEVDPENILTAAVLEMFSEFMAVSEYAQTPGVLDEQWNWQIDATYQSFRDLFMGIPFEVFE